MTKAVGRTTSRRVLLIVGITLGVVAAVLVVLVVAAVALWLSLTA